MKDCLICAGGKYNEGYYRLIDTDIDDLLYQIEVWIELQQELNPELKPDSEKMGWDEDDYEQIL